VGGAASPFEDDLAEYLQKTGCVWVKFLVFSYVLLSSLELSDTKVYEPSIRALLGTASHFFKVVQC